MMIKAPARLKAIAAVIVSIGTQASVIMEMTIPIICETKRAIFDMVFPPIQVTGIVHMPRLFMNKPLLKPPTPGH